MIAFERDDARAWAWHRRAVERGVVPVIPTVAVAETYRGSRSARIARLLRLCTVEPLDERLAKLAGLALAQVDVGVIDAVVAASAAERGDIVLTSDPADLLRLGDFFPTLRVAALS